MSPLGEEPENGAKTAESPSLDPPATGSGDQEKVSPGSNSITKSSSGSAGGGVNTAKSDAQPECVSPNHESAEAASAATPTKKTSNASPDSPRIVHSKATTGDGTSESLWAGLGLPDSPKRFAESALGSEHKTKQTVLQERFLENRRQQQESIKESSSKPDTPRSEHKSGSHHGSNAHSDHEHSDHGGTPRSKHSTPRGEHKQVSRSDSSVSHRKHSVTDSDDDRPRQHHHHHRSPKRAMSERRRVHRSSISSATEHHRSSSLGSSGSGSRRPSVRISERRRSSIYEHGTVSQHRRLSHDQMSLNTEGTKSNGSPVHIEYYKKQSHSSGLYMSPGLSSAYKTPAAEILIASLIIGVGFVALITSVATGIHVWMVVGGACIGLGGMFMLLGLCWYCALARQKRDNEDLALKVLNSKQLLKLARTPSNASQHPPQMV